MFAGNHRIFRNLYLLLASLVLFATGCFNYVKVDPFSGGGERNLQRVVLKSDRSTGGCLGGGTGDSILLIPIEGTIEEKGFLENRVVSPATIERVLNLASRDRSIRAIVLKVNSPGGTVTGSDLIYRMLRKFSERYSIPIYAHIEGIGASGAYYISMSATKINANPTSLTGSIGVIMRSFTVKKLMDKLGIEYKGIKSGDNKDIFSPYVDMTPEQEAFLKTQIMDSYERFLHIVLENRRGQISESDLRKLADGNVYDAKESLSNHLIDSVGYLDDFIDEIKREQNIPTASVISFLPEGKNSYSIYDTDASGPMTLQEAIAMVAHLTGTGMYYLMQ